MFVNKKINVGCGEKKLGGYTNIDIEKKYKPDLCFDASKIENYSQFEDESIAEIRAEHFLEHTNNPEEIMKEWYRILKLDGIIKLKIPHFSRGFTNPTHQRGFDISWILHFDKKTKCSTYVGVDYIPIKIKLKWIAFLEHYPCGDFTKKGLSLLNFIINFFANINPKLCSRIWCFWVGGFEELELEFKKLRNNHKNQRKRLRKK